MIMLAQHEQSGLTINQRTQGGRDYGWAGAGSA